jgi:hypothetical protein
MAVFSIEELRKLSEISDKPCISLYMPTHRTGREVNQDPIRFRNLIGRVEDELSGGGMKEREIDRLMKPVRALLDERPLWQHMGDGFAVFRSPEVFQHYRLPVSFSEFHRTGMRFHLKPLMPLLTGDGLFYTLVLSQKSVRLLRGSRDSVHPVELEDLPGSLAEALNIDEYVTTMQFHTGTSMRSTGRAAIFHGHGAGEDDDTDEIRQFFRKIDDALCRYLAAGNIPVVLAGVDYLLPIYREVSDYGKLSDEVLPGNHDLDRPEEIHAKAWNLLKPHFERDQKRAVERFHEQVSNGMASANLNQVLKSAISGRIDTLFVEKSNQIWGHYEPEAAAIFIEDQPGMESVDLLDRAAIDTIQRGGTVYAVERDQIPSDSPVAAIFRY